MPLFILYWIESSTFSFLSSPEFSLDITCLPPFVLMTPSFCLLKLIHPLQVVTYSGNIINPPHLLFFSILSAAVSTLLVTKKTQGFVPFLQENT